MNDTPIIERFASEVAEHGISSFEPQVSRIVRLARRQRVSLLSVDVLADRTGPSVARERALGRVLSTLVTGSELTVTADAA